MKELISQWHGFMGCPSLQYQCSLFSLSHHSSQFLLVAESVFMCRYVGRSVLLTQPVTFILGSQNNGIIANGTWWKSFLRRQPCIQQHFFFLPRCNLVTNIFLYLACRVWTTQQWTLIVQYSQRLGVIVIQENPKLIWQSPLKLSLEIISESVSCSLTDLVTKIILTGLSKETQWE